MPIIVDDYSELWVTAGEADVLTRKGVVYTPNPFDRGTLALSPGCASDAVYEALSDAASRPGRPPDAARGT